MKTSTLALSLNNNYMETLLQLTQGYIIIVAFQLAIRQLDASDSAPASTSMIVLTTSTVHSDNLQTCACMKDINHDYIMPGASNTDV